MNLKDLAGTIVTFAAAAGVIGGVIYSTGWVIGRADAEDIAQQKANEVQQALVKEQEARSRRDALLQRDLIVLELSYLDDAPELSPSEVRRKESLERQLKRVEDELAEMDKTQ